MTRILDHLLNDARLGLRSLARRPGFTAIAALTLAVGIGGNTAIFSVVHGVLLQALPYPESEQLVTLNNAPNEAGRVPGPMSYDDLADIRDDGRAFSSLVGFGNAGMTLTGLGDPAMVTVSRVTEGLLATFRLAPTLGRDIRRDEFGPNAPSVAVVSHAFWQERFGGDPAALGRSVELNGVSYEVVGVAPLGFDYPNAAAMWVPRALDPQQCRRHCHTFSTIGRLAPNITLEMATAELQQFGVNLEAAYPEFNTGKRFMVRDLKSAIVGDVRHGLWIMLAAVALVLLIACANVANLLLARASSREGETAVRVALGATRGMLARQVFVESALLAVLGGAFGTALAASGVGVLRTYSAGTIPRADDIGIDPTVLMVTLATVVFVTFAFGSIPALTLSRTSLAESLSQIGRGGLVGRGTVKFRRALLVGEVALSAALLVGAGLLLRTFAQLYAVDVGFETRNVMRFNITLPASAYPELERASQFYASLEARIAAMPGVEATGTMFGAPLGTARTSGTALIEGRPLPNPGEQREAAVRPITPGLLTTLGVRLVRGRPLTDADNRAGAEPVALVNEEFVKQHFANEDPIGRRVRVTVDNGFGSPYWRIVGVVGNVRYEALTRDPAADVYMPHAQFGPRAMTVHVRVTPGAPPPQRAILAAVRAIDPNVPMHQVETIAQVISRHVAPTRLYLVLIAAFAVIAAVLAAVGLYGVMSFVVVQRTREIGIRVALGAQRHGIVGLVVSQGMRPVAIGLALGAVGALAGGRFLEAMLFGVRPRDPFVFVSALVLMAVVALVASAIPAMRASGIHPARVLHGE